MRNERCTNVVRFDCFELDLRSGELYNNGQKVQLQEQPFRILKLLTERPGELITREEIRRSLWPNGTVVEFENAVNAAIKKLRIALGDSVEEPHFIETVKRRGYRFIVAVECTATGPAEPANGDLQWLRQEMDSGRPTSSAKPGAATDIAKHWKAFVLAAAVLASFIAAYFYSRATSGLTDKDTIVLADFTNTTGDTVFDDTLRQGLAVQLEQSPFLSLVSEERIQQTLRFMAQPAEARLTPSLAREVCERTGSAAVLEGSIARLGTQYVLGLRAKSCRGGGILDEQQIQAARKEDVLSALSQVASKFRSRVGESLATIKRHDTPLAEATTSSLEALKAYSTGWKILSSVGSAAALPFFKRAIETDPEFAMAHGFLGRVYGDVGESALSAESTRLAWRLRGRTSDRERFWITVAYQTQVTGNLEQARQACELWSRTYPRDAAPHDVLPGMIYPVFGKYEMAVEEARKAIELDPDFAISYNILALNYQSLGRFEKAEDVLQRASKRELQIPEFLVDRYGIAFLKGDRTEMRHQAALGSEKSGAEDRFCHQEALALAYTGRLQEARRRAQRAADLAQQAAQRERAALWATGPAMWEALFGNAHEARRSASAALAFSSARDVKYGVALALAISGDSLLSRKLANDLEASFPEDTAVRFSYLPVLRGLLALNRGEPTKAVELLQAVGPYELGAPPSSFMGFFGALYPIYVRGEAFLTAKRGAEAAVEFQKIVDHRGIVVSDPIGALAHLQLGRAFHMAGDKNKAKRAYNDFLVLWKDADPDLPVLKEAQTEYSALQ